MIYFRKLPRNRCKEQNQILRNLKNSQKHFTDLPKVSDRSGL